MIAIAMAAVNSAVTTAATDPTATQSDSVTAQGYVLPDALSSPYPALSKQAEAVVTADAEQLEATTALNHAIWRDLSTTGRLRQ